MSKWVRILLSLALVIVACCAYLWFFGVQTFYVLEARSVARKQPGIMVTPTELSDLSISQARGIRLSYFGYQFEVPWDDIDEQKTRIVADNKAIIVFRSGNVISFWSSLPNGLISDLLADGKTDRKSLDSGLSPLFGEEAVQSDYALQRAILEATPNKVSLLMPKRQAIQQGVLLMTKSTAVPRAEFGIYSVRTKEFQGFQYGRPQNPPKPLRIELFSNDRHLDILFGQKPDGSTTISQPDINRVVQSIHKLTDESR